MIVSPVSVADEIFPRGGSRAATGHLGHRLGSWRWVRSCRRRDPAVASWPSARDRPGDNLRCGRWLRVGRSLVRTGPPLTDQLYPASAVLSESHHQHAPIGNGLGRARWNAPSEGVPSFREIVVITGRKNEGRPCRRACIYKHLELDGDAGGLCRARTERRRTVTNTRARLVTSHTSIDGSTTDPPDVLTGCRARSVRDRR